MNEPIIDMNQAGGELVKTLREKGTPVDACFQCLRCSAGCPMLEFMDIPPNRIIRMVQYGQDQKVLSSKTLWMCASCQTCTTRCPNEVEIAHMMDVLRQESIRAGVKSPEDEVEKFHRAFVKEIRRGRIHELSMIGRYKLMTGRFTDDMKLGLEMVRRGRMKFIPPRSVGAQEIKAIFKMAKKGE